MEPNDSNLMKRWKHGDDSAADWLDGGSYLVARRINMHIETWDRTSLQEQEAIIGRDKKQGAPLSGGDEFATPNPDRSASTALRLTNLRAGSPP